MSITYTNQTIEPMSSFEVVASDLDSNYLIKQSYANL